MPVTTLAGVARMGRPGLGAMSGLSSQAPLGDTGPVTDSSAQL